MSVSLMRRFMKAKQIDKLNNDASQYALLIRAGLNAVKITKLKFQRMDDSSSQDKASDMCEKDNEEVDYKGSSPAHSYCICIIVL